MHKIPKKDLTTVIRTAESEIYKRTGRRVSLVPFENKVQIRLQDSLRLNDVENEQKLERLIKSYLKLAEIEKTDLLTKEKKVCHTMLRYVYCHLVFATIPSAKLRQIQHQLELRDHTAVIHMKRTADSLYFTKFPPFMNIYNKVKPLYELKEI